MICLVTNYNVPSQGQTREMAEGARLPPPDAASLLMHRNFTVRNPERVPNGARATRPQVEILHSNRVSALSYSTVMGSPTKTIHSVQRLMMLLACFIVGARSKLDVTNCIIRYEQVYESSRVQLILYERYEEYDRQKDGPGTYWEDGLAMELGSITFNRNDGADTFWYNSSKFDLKISEYMSRKVREDDVRKEIFEALMVAYLTFAAKHIQNRIFFYLPDDDADLDMLCKQFGFVPHNSCIYAPNWRILSKEKTTDRRNA